MEAVGLPREKKITPVWTEGNLQIAGELAKGNKDSYGFEYESFEAISSEPLEFEEYADSLLDDLSDLYYFSGVYNRFSPYFLSNCELLEKVVRLLAGCCVTKAVLEQKGVQLQKLDALSIDGLFSCVSYNFRKTHAALAEAREKHLFDVHLIRQECRLYELAERLRATGEKVRLIREGRINADRMLDRTKLFEHSPKESGKKILDYTFDRKRPSFPVLGSMAREILRKQQEEKLKEIFSGQSPSINPDADIPALPKPVSYITEAAEKMRKKSITEEEPDDPKLTEEDAGLRDFWNRYTGKGRKVSTSESTAGSGPSPEVRKKAREKRKKKKR